MNEQYRILIIAPYEGMKAQIHALSQDFPQLKMTVFVGDLNQGAEIVRNNFHRDFDAVISRGGTTKVLRKAFSLPIIDIEISTFDVLCALKLADGLEGRTALVSYEGIASSAHQLSALLDLSIDFYSTAPSANTEQTLRNVQQKGYHAILCDTSANTVARRMGIESFLVTSGIASIRKALEEALLVCRSQKNLNTENTFFRTLLSGQQGETIVFDESENIFLSTLRSENPELLELLRQELQESRQEEERRITRMRRNTLYAIRSQRVVLDDIPYTAFFVNIRKAPVSANQAGIKILSRSEAEQEFYGSSFSYLGLEESLRDEITRINQSKAPVVVSGEDGTGKHPTVTMLYLHSALQNSPLIHISCSLLNDKSWTFLMEHHNSPLTDSGSTLHFGEIDILPLERQKQLLATLLEMEVCKRNRVIFSCICPPDEKISESGARFLNELHGIALFLPPLRNMKNRFSTLVNLALNHMNTDLPLPLLGAEDKAMELLKEFQWPHNYTQFVRVMSELTLGAKALIITAEETSWALRKERHGGFFNSQSENAVMPLDLNRSMAEIEADIVCRVVKDKNGNQSAAAKQLCISRTTLWRILQKQQNT